jgi:hypothetical protein
LVFLRYINEMHGSRRKIPKKNLVRQRCAGGGVGFNYGVKWLMIYSAASGEGQHSACTSLGLHLSSFQHCSKLLFPVYAFVLSLDITNKLPGLKNQEVQV